MNERSVHPGRPRLACTMPNPISDVPLLRHGWLWRAERHHAEEICYFDTAITVAPDVKTT